MRTLGEWGSYLGLPTDGDYAYTLYGVGELLGYLNSFSPSGDLQNLYMLIMGAWGLTLVALAVGMVLSFVGKKSTRMLMPGGIIAMVVAFGWFAAVTYINGEISDQMLQYIGFSIQFLEVTPAVFATAIAGIATTVLAILDRSAA